MHDVSKSKKASSLVIQLFFPARIRFIQTARL
jgi:hypothetical protein